MGCFRIFDYLEKNVAMNIHVEDVCEHMFSVLFDIYLGMGLLYHMFNFRGTAKLFSKLVELLYIFIINALEF